MDQKILLFILLSFAIAFAVAFAITPLVRRFATRIGAVDIPKDERRMHSKPIPTLGGLAIFLSFALCISVMVTAYGSMDNKYIALLCGGLLIVLVGMLDDIYGLKWWMKLFGQIGAALIVAANGITVDQIAFRSVGMWEIPLTVLWIVAITNAINLIDGLDGLACGIVGISCVSLLVVSTFSLRPDLQAVMIVIAALGGSCFGFLPFNINPAKIFMGDTGAMFIGYTLSVIAIQGFFKVNALVSFGAPFLVLGLPILDTLFAIIRRVWSKKNPFKPDRKHLHHRLIDWGFSQKQSVALLYSISAMLGGAAILYSKAAQLTTTLMAGEATSDAVLEATNQAEMQAAASAAVQSMRGERDVYVVWAVFFTIAAFAIGLIVVNYKKSKKPPKNDDVTTETDDIEYGE